MKTCSILFPLLLTFTTGAFAQPYTDFADVDYAGDWQTAAPEEVEVLGGQRLWFVDPISWRKGNVNGSGTVMESSADGFTLEPNSVWSRYLVKVTLLEKPPTAEASDGAASALDRDKVSLARIPVSLLPQIKGKGALVNFIITEVVELGKRFRGTATFENGEVPVELEVGEVEHKKDRMPDVRDLRYGPHAKHVIDLYYPEGFDPAKDEPLPTIVNIHGGGWGALHKDNVMGGLSPLEHGYAIASVAYRYVSEFENPPGNLTPPVTAPLYDAARAIQHLRFHAEELGLDKTRFGATGGSAGGASSIWLALHDDLADPDSDDPISRESTRLQAAVPVQAQSSLDPVQITEWVPNMTYGGHAFFTSADGYPRDKSLRMGFWLERLDSIGDWIAEFSPYEHASADDPPMFFRNSGRRNVPEEDPTHHPKHTEMLTNRLNEVGAQAWFWAEDQDSSEPRYNGGDGVINFWDDHLKK